MLVNLPTVIVLAGAALGAALILRKIGSVKHSADAMLATYRDMLRSSRETPPPKKPDETFY